MSADAPTSAEQEVNKRWRDFVAYIGDHDYNQEQAIALLQLAVKTAEPGSAKKSARLEWQNIFAAVATLTRTDSETLHARLTIGFSPVEFKWMLQNKALYTWHSSPVRFQRCLQCMVAKLGQCGSNAEKTCWSCRSRLTDAPPGASPSSGNALRPPRHIALTMAKTAAKQPIGQPEPDAHISMYEQAKWPLTKRDQTYLSQANKFWSFISTDAFLGITDRRQLLDLTHRACTKRYILYMHKMNKRENVRAAVDLHCLGLTYPQLHAANGAQPSGAIDSELSHESAAFVAAMSSVPAEPCELPGPEAAGHLVLGTLAGQQVSAETAPMSHAPESSSETPTNRRSARLRGAFGAAAEASESEQSPSAGEHDWVNPSEDLLATLRGELDLELRDAPDDSDEGGSRGGTPVGPAKKCRPWHWLKEMRRFGYERQVMPKDQKKKRKRAGMSPTGTGPAAATNSQAPPLELLRRQSSRRKLQQQQPGLDTESSNEDSPADQDDTGEEEDLPEPTRRPRSFRAAGRRSMLLHVHPSSSLDPTLDPDPPTSSSRNPSQLWGGSRGGVPGVQDPPQELSSAMAADPSTLGLGLGPDPFGPAGLPALNQLRNLDPRQGLSQLQSRPMQASQVNRARAGPSGPAAAVASLDLPFSLPFTSSMGSSSLAVSRLPHTLDLELPPGSLQGSEDSLQQRYFPAAHTAHGGSLFTRAAPTQEPHSRQPWPTLNQGGHSHFGLAPSHHSATPTFSAGGALGFNQGAQLPSLFHISQENQMQSSMFGHVQPQREDEDYPIGQLERHYLTHLLSSGSNRDVGLGGGMDTHGAPGGLPPRAGSRGHGSAPYLPSALGFMHAEQQQLLQQQHSSGSTRNVGLGGGTDTHGAPRGVPPRVGSQGHGPAPFPSALGFMQAEQQQLLQQRHSQFGSAANPNLAHRPAEYEPISQGAMNLDQLSALMQAERSQALPALQSQPPLTLAQSYLTSLRDTGAVWPFNAVPNAPPVALNSHPTHGELVHSQGTAYSAWGIMQLPLQAVHRNLDHEPSPAEGNGARTRVSLPSSEPSPLDGQDRSFHRHYVP